MLRGGWEFVLKCFEWLKCMGNFSIIKYILALEKLKKQAMQRGVRRLRWLRFLTLMAPADVTGIIWLILDLGLSRSDGW